MPRPPTGQIIRRRSAQGIEIRHARGCPATSGDRCRCEPSFRAWVWSPRDGKKIRETFPTQAAARLWRADAVGDVKRGKRRAPTTTTLREASDEWIDGAREGRIRTRSGDVFKPSTVRGYEQKLRLYLLPELGGRRLSDVTRRDLQAIADDLLAAGVDASTIRNTFMPARAIFRRALRDGDVIVNPCSGLELPAVRGRRDRIAEPDEAAKLLRALPIDDQAIWATAFYAGLRLGELRALEYGRDEGLDLAGAVIRVRWAWDQKEGRVRPKSAAGMRDVPVSATLCDYLVEHKARTGREAGLVFGRTAFEPFNPSTVNKRAQDAWDEAKPKLRRIGLHEARHTFASLLIEAGVSPKRVSVWIGHSSVAFTLDRYAKLFELQEAPEMERVDEFLARADTAARLAQIEAAKADD